MKILYIIPRFTTGGAERLVLQYATHFQKQGQEVVVASTVGGGELVNEFKKLNIQVFPAGEKSFFGLCKNYFYLKRLKKTFKPDIIHTHVFSADFLGYFLRRGVHWISTQHNVGREYSVLRKIILRFILRKTRQVIAVSGAVERFCLEDLKLVENKVKIVLNGIAVEEWLSVETDNLLVDKKLCLGVIGRLEKQKGHEYLLRALSQVNFDWILYIYGVGSLESDLKKLALDLKIADKIVWQGVKNILLEIKNIDVVVQPSLWEGLSLVIMEAMAAGRLVIASEAAGQELITDQVDGFLFKTGDSIELRNLLDHVDKHQEKMKAVANTASKKAQKEFGIEKNIREIAEIYENF